MAPAIFHVRATKHFHANFKDRFELRTQELGNVLSHVYKQFNQRLVVLLLNTFGDDHNKVRQKI